MLAWTTLYPIGYWPAIALFYVLLFCLVDNG